MAGFYFPKDLGEHHKDSLNICIELLLFTDLFEMKIKLVW